MIDKYDGYMDKECIELCDALNALPGLKTFESCCGHLKEKYSIWFFCDNIDTLSRLGKCVFPTYSDGKWELVVDSTDKYPRGVFWLRSIEVFTDQNEMEQSLSGLISNINYCFKTEFDAYFSQSSLPSDVDVAAERYAKTLFCSNLKPHNDTGICDDCANVRFAFKAGAEWMASQFEKVSG